MQITEKYLIGSDLIQEFDIEIKSVGKKRPFWPSAKTKWTMLNDSKVATIEYLQMANEKQLLSYYSLEDFLSLKIKILTARLDYMNKFESPTNDTESLCFSSIKKRIKQIINKTECQIKELNNENQEIDNDPDENE